MPALPPPALLLLLLLPSILSTVVVASSSSSASSASSAASSSSSSSSSSRGIVRPAGLTAPPPRIIPAGPLESPRWGGGGSGRGRRFRYDDGEYDDILRSEDGAGGMGAEAEAEAGVPPSSAAEAASRTRLGPADGAVRMCSVGKNLLRGAVLRIASDLSGGTPLESIKCRVTATSDGPVDAYRSILNEGGILALWAGTPSRTVEGALLGAMFMVASVFTKSRVLGLTGSKTAGALAGGLVGGVAQAVVMTPAGMVFTSLNVNKGKPGYENDNAITVTRRIIREKGLRGMFIGGGPMAARQASNWASRSMFTEIARTNFKMSKYGMLGEIGSGAIGGIGSCWNTPIETVRVIMQADVAAGLPPKTFGEYWDQIVEKGGYPGLFRGVTPRAVQAIWQTVFMVVVPNMLGM